MGRLQELSLENCRKEKDALAEKLKAAEDRLKEILSYLPKVPTQPYEKELAEKFAALHAKAEGLVENLDVIASCGRCDYCKRIAIGAIAAWKEKT